MYFGKMNYFDLIILILISIGVFRGLLNGLIIEVSSLISLYFGIVGSINYSQFLSEILINYTKWNETTINIFCFILLFITIVWSIMLIAKLITKVLKIAYLGLLNRVFGAIFGGAKWIVILSGVVIIYNSLNEVITVPNKFLEDSFSYNLLLDTGKFIFDWTSKNNWNINNKII
tara:strand:- start:186 stop:707 length:522 start_codon:yes stop_codon:yes gene_type:complete